METVILQSLAGQRSKSPRIEDARDLRQPNTVSTSARDAMAALAGYVKQAYLCPIARLKAG
jgi:hypothetical protein